MQISKTYSNKQHGDALLAVVVVLLLVTMGFFALTKITRGDLFASSALGAHEHGRQISEVALQRTLLDIAAVSDGVPLEALDATTAPWFRSPTTTAGLTFSWDTCAGNANAEIRCEKITQENYYVYRYVTPLGGIDSSSSNPCSPGSRSYYSIRIHAVEKTGGATTDTEGIYWKCS